MLRRRKQRDEPENMYVHLRAMALDAVEHGVAVPAAEHPDVAGLVVDIPAEGGFATVVALADGTTSMYTSTGGGTIGAGSHAGVAAATHALLATAQGALATFADPDDGELPGPEAVRIHLLTPTGGRYADIPEPAFWGEEPHELMPVISAVQDVVTAMREI